MCGNYTSSSEQELLLCLQHALVLFLESHGLSMVAILSGRRAHCAIIHRYDVFDIKHLEPHGCIS